MYLLECKKLCKKYSDNEVLIDLDLKIEKGKIYGLFGKNGSGKSTLLKLINDVLTIDSGEILFNNKNIGVYSKSRISYLPEKSYLDSDMKVKNVINLFTDFYNDFDLNKCNKLLDEFNISKDLSIYELSKGLEIILEIILVMSRKAELYILDEPFDGIDSVSFQFIIDNLIKNKPSNSSIIICTHLIKEVEKIIDEVIYIDKGKVSIASTKKELLKKYNKDLDIIFKERFLC
jgi:ABC-2 type transport system ATP-binding protein